MLEARLSLTLTPILPNMRPTRRVSVLPLLKDTAQFDDLNFVLHHASRVLSKMFKNVAGWSPTKIQVGALSRDGPFPPQCATLQTC